MKPARLLALGKKIWDGYWFIPGAFVLLAIGLSALTLHADLTLGDNMIATIPWLNANDPEGARALLTTIGGSMISVAGVVFSITLAAVVFASGQFGPHLLPAFMQDRSNQTTLGVFIGTFVYCMFALRTIQSGEEAFIPHITLLVALIFAGASIAVLIYFIHHILDSLHVSNICARLGQELIRQIEHRFPATTNAAHGAAATPHGNDSVEALAHGCGYIHTLSESDLFNIACENDLTIRLERSPGDFVTTGAALATVWPPERCPPEISTRICDAYVWGAKRTPHQDIGFLIDQLCGIAIRALSPGINDPFTANDAIHWLGAALHKAAICNPPDPVRQDDLGIPRLITAPQSFKDIAVLIYDRLLPYVKPDPVASAALHEMTLNLARTLDNPECSTYLMTYAEELKDPKTSSAAISP